jgi:hypothetical protein
MLIDDPKIFAEAQRAAKFRKEQNDFIHFDDNLLTKGNAFKSRNNSVVINSDPLMMK